MKNGRRAEAARLSAGMRKRGLRYHDCRVRTHSRRRRAGEAEWRRLNFCRVSSAADLPGLTMVPPVFRWLSGTPTSGAIQKLHLCQPPRCMGLARRASLRPGVDALLTAGVATFERGQPQGSLYSSAAAARGVASAELVQPSALPDWLVGATGSVSTIANVGAWRLQGPQMRPSGRPSESSAERAPDTALSFAERFRVQVAIDARRISLWAYLTRPVCSVPQAPGAHVPPNRRYRSGRTHEPIRQCAGLHEVVGDEERKQRREPPLQTNIENLAAAPLKRRHARREQGVDFRVAEARLVEPMRREAGTGELVADVGIVAIEKRKERHGKGTAEDRPAPRRRSEKFRRRIRLHPHVDADRVRTRQSW